MTRRWFGLTGGRLVRHGVRVLPVGANYLPSTSGCEFWSRWEPSRIRGDLDAMRASALDTVRIFLFWADFEPSPGGYDETCVRRLQEFVGLAQDRGLGCVISLLTIWMNGQLFDLPWRNGRSLWLDAEMLDRQEAYVRHIAEAVADFDNVLAYDLGDEVIHVAGEASGRLTREAVEAWQVRLSRALHSVDPGAIVMQANEASAVAGRHAFGPDNGAGLDLHAVHGYPTWAPFAIESTASPKASCLPGFLSAVASAYGPAMVDELGAYGAADEVAAGYVRASAASCLLSGAQGVLAWCWQDIVSTEKPYRSRPGERNVGLLDAGGRPKAAMGAVQEVAELARSLQRRERPAPAIGVYLPELFRHPGENYIQRPRPPAAGSFGAHLLLKRAHLPFEFASGDLGRYRLVVCPSATHLTLTDGERLAEYVNNGGTLLASPGDYLHGFGGETLFGVRLRDFTLGPEEQAHFTWNGHDYPVDWTPWLAQGDRIPVLEPAGGQVLARYANGSPALVRHPLGKGTAIYVNAPFEAQLDVPGRLYGRRWESLYVDAARIAGVRAPVACDQPDVEVHRLVSEGNEQCIAVNHSPSRTVATLRSASLPDAPARLELPGKGTVIVAWPAGHRASVRLEEVS